MSRHLTPPCIVERVLKVWPKGIALDPCAEPECCNIPADERLSSGGFDVEWPERTFVNPPYGNLKPWLEKAAKCNEVIVLCPVRTHRKWFRFDYFDSVCFLDPIKFVGYKQAFPAPLCVLYTGYFNNVFREVFGDIGRVAKVI